LDIEEKIHLKGSEHLYYGGPVSNIERVLNNLEGLNDFTMQKYNLLINIEITDGF